VREQCPVDADARASLVLEPEAAWLEQAVEGRDAGVRSAGLDPGDRLLGDAGLGGQLALRQARATPSVSEHPAGHRHLDLPSPL
jgi:hypothetical protein